jgi:hypothetical protein
MRETIYQTLTKQFNQERLRAILSSGQAVVMHRLAIMSKDGDWILRDDEECLNHVLSVLESHGARYRFGAPLDLRWLSNGWSSHFEFLSGNMRVRTDFVTCPPRITPTELRGLWERAEASNDEVPFVDVPTLIELKKTNREKDYVVIGELARRIEDPARQLLAARSARDIMDLVRRYPDLAAAAERQRPLLVRARDGSAPLEVALDAERRELIHANEQRLQSYIDASHAWRDAWPEIGAEIEEMSLRDAHRHIVRRAERVLPQLV